MLVYRPTFSPMSTSDGTAGMAFTILRSFLNDWLDEPKSRARTLPPPMARICKVQPGSEVMLSRAAEPPRR